MRLLFNPEILEYSFIDLMNLWTIPNVGEVDEVKSRQLRLAKMMEGNYDEEEEMEETIVQEPPKVIDYEKELSLPPVVGKRVTRVCHYAKHESTRISH